MSTAFDNLPRAGFAGFPFPITHLSVKGSIRKHVHEYPHSDGGQPEKLGRRLYTIKMRALFMDVFKTYPGLYPDTLNNLVSLFELSSTGTLVVPTVGTIQCMCTDWPREADFAKIRSGEIVELEFLEDPQDVLDSFLVTNLNSSAQTSIGASLKLAPSYPTVPVNLLQSIQNAINAVQGIINAGTIFGQTIANQVNGIVALFQQLDSDPAMQNPANYPVMSAAWDAWSAMVQFQQSLSTKQGTLKQYVVPSTMSISQVSTAIFGNTSQAVTLLQSNALDDALAIPAGTIMSYLQ